MIASAVTAAVMERREEPSDTQHHLMSGAAGTNENLVGSASVAMAHDRIALWRRRFAYLATMMSRTFAITEGGVA